ncbi:hypothetical protein A3D88_02425 [Candidatus Peribacteria bacterium RIFCSPHIGHO2_02_FULL_52_16]|nr:MAG: hypothetical protein A2706_00250 [Candidatus Peribacteria bacterium RIFCSPHIGHO2_01_FULL_51_35]OGJ61618.1 MAG: hypothetical protein A3D88_02425 [Candidatus Peribacteria bacterium RIFCSPHIGHO2_02_FULL_52_16]
MRGKNNNPHNTNLPSQLEVIFISYFFLPMNTVSSNTVIPDDPSPILRRARQLSEVEPHELGEYERSLLDGFASEVKEATEPVWVQPETD